MNINKECPICLDELSKHVIKLNCGHFFHPNCINDWKKINNVCPVCRERIGKIMSVKTKAQIIINYIIYLSILTIIFYLIKSKRIINKLKNNIFNTSRDFINLINNIKLKYHILSNSKEGKSIFNNLYNNLSNIFYDFIFFKEKIIMMIPNLGSYIRSALPKIILAFHQKKQNNN